MNLSHGQIQYCIILVVKEEGEYVGMGTREVWVQSSPPKFLLLNESSENFE